MDFRFSEDEEAYRTEVRAWLGKNLAEWRERLAAPSDSLAEARAYQRTLHAAGYVGATWPVEYGGRARSAVENAILQEEMARASAPAPINSLGLGLCGPAIMHHGRDDQRARFLPKMLTGEELWCQGYSEPGAGSDLASIQTRAERSADTYIVNGQKIWTSMASDADWCFALVRTDPEAIKQAGIGFLLIDMATPGIEVRPITQITGAREFCEVFFTDVNVSADNMVGEPTQGWRIANTVLGYERGANTLSQHAAFRRKLDRIAELAPRGAGASAAVTRQRIAQLAIDIEVLRLNSLRQLTALSRGEAPGSEASIQKVLWSELDQRLHKLGGDLAGRRGELYRDRRFAVDGGDWAFGELNSLRFSIARGTNEIQRNIVAERVLGLPRR